jgi:hypothetical protein
LNYETAQIKLRDANLKIRILAERRDLPLDLGQLSLKRPKAASGWIVAL